MKRLASAILIQTIKDLETGNYQADIQEFLDSKWFEMWVEAAGLEREWVQAIRSQLTSGIYQRMSLRAGYR